MGADPLSRKLFPPRNTYWEDVMAGLSRNRVAFVCLIVIVLYLAVATSSGHHAFDNLQRRAVDESVAKRPALVRDRRTGPRPVRQVWRGKPGSR